MEMIDTASATAEYLRVPEATLRQWRHLRKGPPYLKVGKHVRYRRADVDDWVTQLRVTPDQKDR